MYYLYLVLIYYTNYKLNIMTKKLKPTVLVMIVISSFDILGSCFNTGVGKCPNFTHHPILGDISSPTYFFSGDVQNPQVMGTFGHFPSPAI